ncbi:VIT and vWA domain-containing protein [Coraliomargarita parva]|uniref:VIT and vWA domain-containing protein n=1 Tax=Coraliomargarita parva TaxID=3014050 RepID=UPI0022B37A18|nr:VIT and VWA domain-containing protein [Coraliomargarita parva]
MKHKTRIPNIHSGRAFLTSLLCAAASCLSVASLSAAGILTPTGSADQPVEIMDHHVDVRIADGFARTVIQQTFSNPNPHDVEALYAFPVPESASLSEITIHSGETVLEGEVIPRAEAERIYEEEKSKGNDVGMGSKESYQRFEFRVFPVRPGVETRIEVVYYQPLKIDLGVGRYVYPIEEGGTDEEAESFWTRNEKVARAFSAEVTVRSGYPLDDIRIKGFPGDPVKQDANTYTWRYDAPGGTLNQDLVVYYQLARDLPGRVDMLTYKASEAEPGYFMMTLTPGVDLAPITQGSDYLFILDLSGSMNGKMATLTAGVEKAIGKLRPEDRVHIVTFADAARNLTRDWVALTSENVNQLLNQVAGLKADGSTNLYDGLRLGLKQLDDDRPTNVILITDAVTNTGALDPADFHKLLKQHDVRLFGFLMGNSSNWPLMRAICDASDGFYSSVSNADDIVGKILQAKEKIAYEALLDVDVKIKGLRTSDLTKDFSGKVFRGQQLTIFGRYQAGGEAQLSLDARKTTGELNFDTIVDFPDSALDYPELERLWAMSRIEQIELQQSIGQLSATESKESIRDLGVAYQLVTDETSMIVMADEGFQRHGIDRKNKARIATEHTAQAQRQATYANNAAAGQPVQSPRVDKKPMFPSNAPRIGGGGGGGGAFGLESIALLMLTGLGVWFRRLRRS